MQLLMIDTLPGNAQRVTNRLRDLGLSVRVLRLEEESEAREVLEEQDWDLIICAAMSPPLALDAVQMLHILKQSGKDIPLIVLIDEATDAEAIDEFYRAGARDVVPKSHSFRFQYVVRRELRDLENRRACRRNEKSLEEVGRRARILLDSSRDASAYVHEGMHLHANRAYLRLLGCHKLNDIEGLPLLNIAAPEEHGRFKVFLQEHDCGEREQARFGLKGRRVDGKTFTATLELIPASHEGEPCTQIVIRDEIYDSAVEEDVEQTQPQEGVATLFNRQYLLELLDKTVPAVKADGDKSSLFYVALDQFPRIRERLGIGISDRIIHEIVLLLQQHCGENASVFRFGEEAFTLIVTGASNDEIDLVAGQLRQTVSEHSIGMDGRTINVTCSIGICPIEARAAGGQQILEHAYKACIKAREGGGNRVECHSFATVEQEQVKRWEARLRQALDNDRFRLLYQPVVSLHGETKEIYEVLLRLVDEADSVISPTEFLEPAAQLGLLIEIDRWVIAKASEILLQRYREGHSTRFLVKLSDSSIHDPDLLPWLEKHLQENPLDACSLVFEISENTVLDSSKQAESLIKGARALGCCPGALRRWVGGIASYRTPGSGLS